MKHAPKKSWIVIIGILGFIVFFSIANIVYFLSHESIKKPIIKEKANLYSFYLAGVPNINGRLFYGDPAAPLTMVAYLDTRAPSSHYFMREIFPSLEREYIGTGKLKFYFKQYILLSDFEKRNEHYTDAAAMACVRTLAPVHYYDILFSQLTTDATLKNQITRYNISLSAYDACIEMADFPELREDISEIEQFGMVGLNQRFYIGLDGSDNTIINGVPEYQNFRRIIRLHQITLGE